MGIKPTGFLALNEVIRSHISVLSGYVQTADGRRYLRDAPDIPGRRIIEDYRLIQYDLLMGEQYALKYFRTIRAVSKSARKKTADL